MLDVVDFLAVQMLQQSFDNDAPARISDIEYFTGEATVQEQHAAHHVHHGLNDRPNKWIVRRNGAPATFARTNHFSSARMAIGRITERRPAMTRQPTFDTWLRRIGLLRSSR